MKKKFMLTLTLCLSTLMLFACGNTAGAADAENEMTVNTQIIQSTEQIIEVLDEAVRSGDLYMTVLQDTVGQGAAAAQGAVTLAKGGSVSSVSGASDDHKYIWVPFVPITPQNVDQYK